MAREMRGVLGMVAALVAVATSAAGVEPETIALEYAAPDGCPSERAFSGEVSARTALARFSSQAPSRKFRVTIEAREAGFAGRLEIVDTRGERSVREIDGASCSDVV